MTVTGVQGSGSRTTLRTGALAALFFLPLRMGSGVASVSTTSGTTSRTMLTDSTCAQRKPTTMSSAVYTQK